MRKVTTAPRSGEVTGDSLHPTASFSSAKGLELLSAQSKTQDASCLPALKVSDIEPTIPITPVQISAAGTPRHR